MMGTAAETMNLVEKLFEQALKRKLSQLAREYDPDLVSELWTQIAKREGGRDYFGGWKWTPDMTIKETLSSINDYLKGLHSFLPQNQARHSNGGKKCY